MQEARRRVEQVLEEGEAERFEDVARGAVVGVMPGIEFRQPQFAPAIIERAARRFRCEALAPAPLHDVEAELEIRLGRGVDPGPQPAAADKTAAAAFEQGPVLHPGFPLPRDLGAELLRDLFAGEPAAGVDQCRHSGIAPQLDREGQVAGPPRPRHQPGGREFFGFSHGRRP